MNRLLVSFLFSILLVSALSGSLLVDLTIANPVGLYYPWSPPPTPIVKVTGLNTVKHNLTFLVQKEPWITPYGMGADYESSRQYGYSISSIRVLIDGKQWSQHDWGRKPISVSLGGLSNGKHTVEITATAYGGDRYISQGSSGVIEFQVDNPPPSVFLEEQTETHQSTPYQNTWIPSSTIASSIIASVATIFFGLVSFGLVACFVKRNRRRGK